jgi:hypothetical protein
MDPDVALSNARDALTRYRFAQDAQEREEDQTSPASDQHRVNAEDAASDLAGAFEALDGWMSGRGFAPAAWPRP